MNQEFCKIFLEFIDTIYEQSWISIKNSLFPTYESLIKDQTLLNNCSNLKSYVIDYNQIQSWSDYKNQVILITNIFLKDNQNLPYFLFSSLLLRLFINFVNYCETHIDFLKNNNEELVTHLRKLLIKNKN